jgi:hypothetical protein
MVDVRIAHDYAIKGVHTPAPQKIDNLRAGLVLSGVKQVVLAAGLDEHPVTLTHVYKAHDQRSRGWQLGGTRSRKDAAAARTGEEQQGDEQDRDEMGKGPDAMCR